MKYNRLTLQEKAKRVAREIVRTQKKPELRRLANKLKTPGQVFDYLRQKVQYQTESTDHLYNPVATLRRGYGDCEDQTLLMGTLAAIQGYPVWIRIIRNGTNHILPFVFQNGRWVKYDLSPQSGTEGALKNYTTYTEGLVTDKGLSMKRKQPTTGKIAGQGELLDFFQEVIKNIPVGLGIGLGTAAAGWLFKEHLRGILSKNGS